MDCLETYKGFGIYFLKGLYKIKKGSDKEYYDDSFTSRERAYNCIDRLVSALSEAAVAERKKVKEAKKKVTEDIKKNSEEYEKLITGA